ncbi:hypothetical protein Pcinc_000376 [Petrolisthes cinctipes]|uniref:Uncharacterized protein n=1 Tax=Petrolisthes cinctipes TaxID=88211 RepID=A0AAE1G5S1_PETCI|nr:hypothetical protein Pcinc_008905 [Petrolisthes cinctipes]KAK3891905.1 hypothetical protein Pcinc_004211 [Petrolisthes cinctipes]KAK3893550.1 hypothetical protein Pcinc_002615 [Petrolisthes cinctipes]KAK3895992.1 hypothetical protein Pcinc_000376 [Petrolisthes cinctipes]
MCKQNLRLNILVCYRQVGTVTVVAEEPLSGHSLPLGSWDDARTTCRALILDIFGSINFNNTDTVLRLNVLPWCNLHNTCPLTASSKFPLEVTNTETKYDETEPGTG